VISLDDNKTGFQFTYAQYFTPLGNKVHEEGITPDTIVEMPEELMDKFFDTGDLSDPQLMTAYQVALANIK
jgi:C-terminal processing protease CtpA/Prc